MKKTNVLCGGNERPNKNYINDELQWTLNNLA